MKDKIILALDLTDVNEALSLADELRGGLSHIKIGHQLYAQGGMEFVKKIIKMGHDVFLDLKLHDIPNTVRMAVEELSSHGLWALSIHSAGGRKMLEEASKAAAAAEVKLLAISVLTSFSQDVWQEVNPNNTIRETLEARAKVVAESGVHGMVCSPLDLPIVMPILRGKVMTVVPGVRLFSGGPKDDQERAATPECAVSSGADYIVVGRPILEARDRMAAIEEFAENMKKAIRNS
ncbi:MAG: orotidine-5'-phosphate decarboxylase [Synergistaceae bacterium]|nr:orotidine-5'-phosphate decarboxylase [Synergistaceae bacterium]